MGKMTGCYPGIIHRKGVVPEIFNERKDLVCNWFDLWTDAQRKKFLAAIFSHCRRSQLIFTQKYFNDHVPLKHLDFTKVLPRSLSLYIMSFLDPRSLSRASLVSWHWKFLAEQDNLWMPKCTKLGWYLPYSPADNEYGAWKRHYIACTMTLDMNVPTKEPLSMNEEDSAMYGTFSDGSLKTKKVRQKGISEEESTLVMTTRPDWVPPDKTPRDLEKSSKALFQDYNPNDPEIHRSLTVAHNRFGIPKSKLSYYRNTAETLAEYGLQSSARKSTHRALGSEDLDLRHSFPMALSETVKLENFEEKRLMELVAQPWDPPPPEKLPVPRRPNLSGGGDYPIPWKHNTNTPVSKSFPSQQNPRIIFISSRVPAADVLVDAVNFGVIPIVYEYEGTSLESLLSRLDSCLQGRNAKSIGLFTHSETPFDDLRLAHGFTVNVDNLDTPDFMNFFETVANAVLPCSKKGHIDIFAPVASCELGQEMLRQLNIVTGIQFTSPTGIIGQYNHVRSEWLSSPEENPPDLYFCCSKLNVWANTADQAREACLVTRNIMAKYFEQVHKDVVSQLTGQVVFDALGQVDIQGVDEVSAAVVEGLITLGHQKNAKPVEFLGKYLLERAGVYDQQFSLTMPKKRYGDTLAPTATMKANTLSHQFSLTEQFEESLPESEELDSEVAGINHHKKNKDHENKNKIESEKDDSEVPEEDIIEEIEEIIESEDNIGEKQDKEFPEKHVSMKSDPRLKVSSNTLTSSGTNVTETIGFLTSRLAKTERIPRRLTPEEFASAPEKRSLIGREILASEIEYTRTLSIVKHQFYIPLRSALDSNRAVISAQNTQVIFTDAMALLELSKSLVDVLKSRIHGWSPDQCIGDIFVKFCSKLKAFTNFLNNYPIILHTIERCMEQTPVFRAFLKRHERQPMTKMMTLPELLLAPGRRVTEYVTLLTWFRTFTPEDHADRNDLASATKVLSGLEKLFKEVKDRAEREREITQLQTKILKCPMLLEGNRFFLRQLDVARMEGPSNSIVPELRVYKHIEMLGLYLFNDSLVVTRRTTKNFPFERRVEHNYRFDTCTSLNRLRIDDIPDSKYIRNAFRMHTPRREWICATDTFEEKFNWISLLEYTIRTALGVN